MTVISREMARPGRRRYVRILWSISICVLIAAMSSLGRSALAGDEPSGRAPAVGTELELDALGVPSMFVPIAPARILDTRRSLGLADQFVSVAPRTLKVTGAVPTTTGRRTVVPNGATGVSLNVTAVSPTEAGFLTVRPGGQTGVAETSSLNFKRGDVFPNAVTVALSSSGTIQIIFDAYGNPGHTTHVLVDVVGYYVRATNQSAPTTTAPVGEEDDDQENDEDGDTGDDEGGDDADADEGDDADDGDGTQGEKGDKGDPGEPGLPGIGAPGGPAVLSLSVRAGPTPTYSNAAGVVQQFRQTTGTFMVQFNRSISTCSVSTTIAGNDSDFKSRMSVTSAVVIEDGTLGSPAQGTRLKMRMWDSSGNLTNGTADDGFDLLVFCLND